MTCLAETWLVQLLSLQHQSRLDYLKTLDGFEHSKHPEPWHPHHRLSLHGQCPQYELGFWNIFYIIMVSCNLRLLIIHAWKTRIGLVCCDLFGSNYSQAIDHNLDKLSLPIVKCKSKNTYMKIVACTLVVVDVFI